MKRHPVLFVLTAISLASAPVAFAHPGHDGHELTWDYGHLAAHPLATLGCFLTICVLAEIGWRFVRPAADPHSTKEVFFISSSIAGPVQALINEFSKLPTIGPKTAARLVFHLLANEPHSERYGPEGVKYLVGRKWAAATER